MTFAYESDESIDLYNKLRNNVKLKITERVHARVRIARLAGINKDYFSRIFHSIMGMNYNKWLNTFRLERATELLADPDMPLTEVAMRSGFQIISSFNRVFREDKGMSPREYRTLFAPSDQK